MICGGAVNVYFSYIPAGDEHVLAVAEVNNGISTGVKRTCRHLSRRYLSPIRAESNMCVVR